MSENNLTPEQMQGMPQAKMTAPFPPIETDITKYYYNSLPNASMHRQDGQRILFINNVFKSHFEYDHKFLDGEIKGGHPHLRMATEAEIQQYKMFLDPRGTIKEELKSDPELRSELEAKIRAEMLEKHGITIPADETVSTNISSERLAGTEGPMSRMANGIRTGNATILQPVSTADIAGGAKQSGK